MEKKLHSMENKDEVAQYNLGKFYEFGIRFDKNESIAFDYY